MSHQNIEAVRRIFDGWAQGDLHAGAEDFDEHVAFVVGPDFPEFGVVVGLEAVREFMHRFLAHFERTTFEAEHLQAVGDTVFVRLLQRGTGAASGAEVEHRFFQLFTFRGGKIVRLESILRESDALAAVGLQE